MATARTRKRVVSGIALEVGWTSVDDAIGEAIEATTKIEDDDDDEIDDVEIKLEEVVEINWDDVIEEIEVVTSVLELAPTIVREDGKLSTIAT